VASSTTALKAGGKKSAFDQAVAGGFLDIGTISD